MQALTRFNCVCTEKKKKLIDYCVWYEIHSSNRLKSYIYQILTTKSVCVIISTFWSILFFNYAEFFLYAVDCAFLEKYCFQWIRCSLLLDIVFYACVFVFLLIFVVLISIVKKYLYGMDIRHLRKKSE